MIKFGHFIQDFYSRLLVSCNRKRVWITLSNIGGLLENTSIGHRLWGRADQTSSKAETFAELSLLPSLLLLFVGWPHSLVADCLFPCYTVSSHLATISLSLFLEKISSFCPYAYTSSSAMKSPKESFSLTQFGSLAYSCSWKYFVGPWMAGSSCIIW